MYTGTRRSGPHSQINNKNNNEIKNKKIVAWEESRVFVGVLRSIVKKRLERSLLLLRLAPKKNIKKLVVLEKIYMRKLKVYLYDIVGQLVNSGLDKNKKQLARVNIPLMLTHKIEKIYISTIGKGFLKLKHKAIQSKLRTTAIDKISHNIRLMTPKLEQQTFLYLMTDQSLKNQKKMAHYRFI